MKQVLLFLAALLLPLYIYGKTTYTYKLVVSSAVPNNNYESWVYPNADNLYYFHIELSPFPSGLGPKGKFTVKLQNAKFSDGKTQMDVGENVDFLVKYDDVIQFGIVSITGVPTDTANTILQTGSPTAFSYPIASLKGQIPDATISDNPLMGNTQPITAQIWSDMVYPDFVVKNIIGLDTDLKVGGYEWTIPSGWKTSTGKQEHLFLTLLIVKMCT